LLGADDNTDCLECPPGSYCATAGIGAPTGLCSAGYFCPGGNTDPAPPSNLCSIGYMCPAGSVQQIRCDVGTYQDATSMATCPSCPIGSYCFASSTPTLCELGFYCPGNDKKVSCPPG